jgi:hypothetical protein
VINLRKLARDQECQVRSPVCNFDRATSVLAHYREIGISGAGYKSPDLLGAHCCSACHTLVDTGRYGDIELLNDERDLLLLRGMARTQAKLIREGKLLCE